MPSWNKTEKKTSGKRSGWKEAEGKVSEQKWEDRLYVSDALGSTGHPEERTCSEAD